MTQSFFDTVASMAGCAAFALGPVAGPVTASVLTGVTSLFDALGQKDGPSGFPEIEAMQACFEELKQRQFYDKINDSLSVFNAKYKWFRSAYVSAWGLGSGKAGWPDIKEAFENSLNMALSANDNFLEKIEALKLGEQEFQRLALPAFYYGVTLFILFNQTYYLIKTAEHGKQPYFQGLSRLITDVPEYIDHSQTMLNSISNVINERNNKVGGLRVMQENRRMQVGMVTQILTIRHSTFTDSGAIPAYTFSGEEVRNGGWGPDRWPEVNARDQRTWSDYKANIDKTIRTHYYVPSLVVDPKTGARSQSMGDAKSAYEAIHNKLNGILADAKTTNTILRQAYGGAH